MMIERRARRINSGPRDSRSPVYIIDIPSYREALRPNTRNPLIKPDPTEENPLNSVYKAQMRGRRL
jgi:hypothetical protein